MVLDFLGKSVSESELIRRLQIRIPIGTPFPVIEKVQTTQAAARLVSLSGATTTFADRWTTGHLPGLDSDAALLGI